MLQRIMVALDGSKLGEQGLAFASALARAFESEVVLLRVVETPSGAAGRSLDSFDWRMERTEAITYLDGIKERLRVEGISVDVDVTAGRASEEILEMARARDVDLLVLVSHGVGGLSEFRMASTAQKVVFAATMSVLVVPARESVADETPFETVLVPVDCSPHSDWAVTLAATLARSQGAELVVLHIVKAPTLLEPHGTARERQIVDEIVALNRGAASRHIEALTRRLESPDLRIRSLVDVADEVAPALERHTTAEARPLLVLNARGSSRFDQGPCGSLTALLLAGIAHPVLVLREPSTRRRKDHRWTASTVSADARRATI